MPGLLRRKMIAQTKAVRDRKTIQMRSTVVVVLDEDQNRRVDAHEAGELLTKQCPSNHDVHRQLRLPAILLLPAPRSIYF